MLPLTHHHIGRPYGGSEQGSLQFFTILRGIRKIKVFHSRGNMQHTAIQHFALEQMLIRCRFQTSILHDDWRIMIDIARLKTTLGNILYIHKWK